MKLRASFGTLRFIDGKPIPGMRTAYFMLDGGCVFDCSYCTHARSSSSRSDFLSRITWKEIDLETALKIAKVETVKRVCIQTVSYPGYREDLLRIIEILRFKPVSVSVRAVSPSEVDLYFEAGADTVGIPIDAVNEDLFRIHRGGSLKRHLKVIEESSKRHPGRITTHMIVGLGETEKDIVELMDLMKSWNVTIALFAFTPLRGTKMENHPKPDLDSYRRIQIARYLIEKGISRFENFKFDDDGRITDFGVDLSKIDYKKAFLTSGCRDCTRPYYNERPGDVLYNVHDEALLEDIASFNVSTTTF